MAPPKTEQAVLKKILYLLACGTPQAQQLYELLPLPQVADWDVWVILTPSPLALL